MCGIRDAAQKWEKQYEQTFLRLGFAQGKSSPCVFYHAERDLRIVVHGDDITSAGDDEQLKWLQQELETEYALKLRALLGPDPTDDKEVRILNRVVTWSESGLTYEADSRHAEIIIRDLGLTKAKAVTTPGVKESTASGASPSRASPSPSIERASARRRRSCSGSRRRPRLCLARAARRG